MRLCGEAGALEVFQRFELCGDGWVIEYTAVLNVCCVGREASSAAFPRKAWERG